MNEFVLIYRFLTDYSTAIKYFDLATLVGSLQENQRRIRFRAPWSEQRVFDVTMT